MRVGSRVSDMLDSPWSGHVEIIAVIDGVGWRYRCEPPGTPSPAVVRGPVATGLELCSS